MTLQRARERIARMHLEGTDEELGPANLGWNAAVRDAVLVLDEELADDLGAAWAEAEGALPEGWKLGIFERFHGDPQWNAQAVGLSVGTRLSPFRSCDGLTPAAALRSLAAALRARRP